MAEDHFLREQHTGNGRIERRSDGTGGARSQQCAARGIWQIEPRTGCGGNARPKMNDRSFAAGAGARPE